jgi:hypothetical protein
MDRLQLQTMLENLLGSRHVYFQPPENVKMAYPCIKYAKGFCDTRFANDNPYSHLQHYELTVIDKNPDSLIPGKVAALPTCKFDRRFTADNLNHVVYNIYY